MLAEAFILAIIVIIVIISLLLNRIKCCWSRNLHENLIIMIADLKQRRERISQILMMLTKCQPAVDYNNRQHLQVDAAAIDKLLQTLRNDLLEYSSNSIDTARRNVLGRQMLNRILAFKPAADLAIYAACKA